MGARRLFAQKLDNGGGFGGSTWGGDKGAKDQVWEVVKLESKKEPDDDDQDREGEVSVPSPTRTHCFVGSL